MEKHIYPECMCLLFISLYRSWAIFLRNIISNFNVNNESLRISIFFYTMTPPPPPPPHTFALYCSGNRSTTTLPSLAFISLHNIQRIHVLDPSVCNFVIGIARKFVRRNSKYIRWAIDSSRSRSVLIQCSRTIHFWDEWTLVLEGGLCFNSISQPSLDIWKTSFMHIILARWSSTKVSFSRTGFTFARATNFSTYSTLQCRNAMKLFLACGQFPCTCSSNWFWFRVPDCG
jgi:hypothetical protein